jgi:diaminohydroxyphosphoribosylaminopyrimidine deaminase/5-amino-6-(5-phosphoribosylamino)uracil reductase
MDDIEYLKRALSLAWQRRGFCAPNPSVGAVIVKDHQIFSEGNHPAAGLAHAEVVALQALKEKKGNPEGATLYVTLEPCCHQGKTPPCTDAIIQSGIKKVIYSFKDPNPKVSGHGEKILREAGIECRQIPIDEINEFYKSYNRWVKSKLPFVTAKLAVSLDGKIAGKKGQRVMLTGEEAEKFTHQCRHHSDAILTSAKTIIQDNPSLNIRLSEEIIAKPVYILERDLSVPKDAKIFKTASNVIILHEEKLLDAIKKIGEAGIHDLWVEVGGNIFSALIEQKLVQRVFIYIAPMVIGNLGIEGFIANTNLFNNIKNIQWKILGHDAVCEMNWEED